MIGISDTNISSLDCCAQVLGDAVRKHWGIENSVHWVLDIAFREDESRIRKGAGPENFAASRHIALNLLSGDKSFKGSVKSKRGECGNGSKIFTGRDVRVTVMVIGKHRENRILTCVDPGALACSLTKGICYHI